jgi:phosphoribosylformimino-5-aminoimidazole carboxamide ribonucleotide (ProFAR) isomerase
VPFSILPALDVSAGHLVVVEGGRPRPVAAFGGDPVAAARAMVQAGAAALHLVDVDLALDGTPGLDVAAIRDVAPRALLQVSGGIGDLSAARPYLAAGADRFVLGSVALTDEAATLATLRDAGAVAVVGLEVDEGRIRPRGSGPDDPTLGLDLMSTVGWLHAAGAPAFLVTATGRVAGLEGPDVTVVGRVARAGRPTLAAGGVRSLDDLRALRDVGAAGAVVGRAALEGRIALDAALVWAAT